MEKDASQSRTAGPEWEDKEPSNRCEESRRDIGLAESGSNVFVGRRTPGRRLVRRDSKELNSSKENIAPWPWGLFRLDCYAARGPPSDSCSKYRSIPARNAKIEKAALANQTDSSTRITSTEGGGPAQDPCRVAHDLSLGKGKMVMSNDPERIPSA